MKVYTDITKAEIKRSAVTVGKFDAIHLGHRSLINRIKDYAKDNGVESTVISFDVSKFFGNKVLNHMEERIEIFKETGIDNVIFMPVNKETMSMEPVDFVRLISEKTGACHIVTGKDFRFGKNRGGDIKTIENLGKEYGYTGEVVENVYVDGEKVSTSVIKNYIEDGKIKEANAMLGYEYFITEDVVKGKQIGRTMNIRTINMIPDETGIVPGIGVYKTTTIIEGKEYKSLTNVGTNPTFGENRLTVETHILDFSGNLYNSRLKVKFLDFIREEKKFNDKEALKRQILLDISCANL